MNMAKRTLCLILCDFVVQLVCFFIIGLIFPGMPDKADMLRIGASAATMLVVYPLIHRVFGVYKIVHRYAQTSEYFRFFSAFMAGGVAFSAVMLVEDIFLPGGTYSVAFLLFFAVAAACGMFAMRLVYRIYATHVESEEKKPEGLMRNTLIVGCGQACLMLLNEVKIHPEYGIKPVVAVDIDPAKKGRTISGVPIEGTDEDIPTLAKKYDVRFIIVAIPSADNKQRARILENCKDVDIEVKMLPRVADFESEDTGVFGALRDFTMDELLGRDPIEINHEEVNAFIRGKRVLVTGGGGSIGSELCRQIASNSPELLVIVDIYENNAYEIQQELVYKYGDKLNLETIIASVRDYERMSNIMAEYKPEIVIHAAAHKHVPLMEHSPQEAIKNNVLGTYNTARAAIKNGVAKFILISTDKAVNPTNIMGASKRLCEMVIQSLNGEGTLFSAVRFGNVLGSNGSVIPLFRKQIEAGGPVTVTHPDIIRFFMTIPEAVQLVLLASTKAEGGEIFVLNMGSPVKIADLAKRIILLSGKKPDVDIKIEYTGLRPGEKLYEELMMHDEHLAKTQNDMIFVGHFVDFDKQTVKKELSVLKELANNNELSKAEMLKALEKKITELVPTFHRPPPN